MTKISCKAIDCIYWEDGRCATDKIIYDPEEGCLTYALIDDMIDGDDWDKDDDLDITVDDDDPPFAFDDDDPEDDAFSDSDDENW